MKKIYFFIIVLVLQPVFVHSQQWFLYKDFPLNVVPKDIDSSNDGTLFMLTTDFNYYYKPLNGEWTMMNQPLLSNGHSILVDKNSNRLYVATGYLGIYYTSNYGATWGNTYLTTNPVSGHHEGYLCFTGTENPNLFFAGLISLSSQITRFTNQGTSGEFKTIDPSGSPNSSAQSMYYTANQKLLIGTINNGIWISENNANSFVQTNLSSGNVFKFTEDSNGKVYALRKDLSSNEITLISSEDYMNWNTLELPDNNETYTTLFYDNQSASLWVGNNSAVFKTPVSAISWQNQNLNNPAPNSVEIINDSHNGLYLFTVNEAAQKLNGNQWETQNSGLTGETNAITIDSDNKLFTYINFFSNRISSATSPAESWNYADLDPEGTASGIRNFSISNENEILSTTFNKIYKSNDNGATYSELNNPAGITNIGIAKTGTNNNLFVTSYFGDKLYKSTNEGQSWQEIFDGSPVFNSASIIDFLQNGNGELFLLLFDASNGFRFHLYGSVDDGETWDLLFENNTFSDGFTIEGKLLSFGTQDYIVTDYSVFEINMLSGPPTEINLPISPASHIPILSFTRTSSGELLINYYLDEFYKSSDNGTSWTGLGHPVSSTSVNPNPIGPAIHLNDLPFWIISPNNQWNVPPGIYYYLEDILSTKDATKNTAVIYPNPAFKTIYIKTGYRGNCKVFDFSGKLLMEKSINGELTQINIDNLPAGTYILRFENGESYKIIKR